MVIAVDQMVKLIVSAALPLGGAWSPFAGPNPFFQIIYTANTGVAFGLFKDLGPVFIIVPLIVSGVILSMRGGCTADQRFMALALGFMLGGALGNVIDRIRVGDVIDFFDVGLGSFRNASNFADWCIVLGVILLAIAMCAKNGKRNSVAMSDRIESVDCRGRGRWPARSVCGGPPGPICPHHRAAPHRRRFHHCVTDAECEADDKVKPGDEIIVRVPPPVPTELIAEDIPLAIVYEDDDVIVIDKPAGLVVHPAAGHASGTLVNAVMSHVPIWKASAAKCGPASCIGSIKTRRA